MTGAQVYRYTSIKWVHTGIAVDSSWGYDAAAYQQLYQAQIKRFFQVWHTFFFQNDRVWFGMIVIVWFTDEAKIC